MHEHMKAAMRSLRSEARNLVGARPRLYVPMIRLGLIGGRKQLANRQTAIVIEGFPRSGNSFACAAFRLANPQVTQIGTHLHVPAHVLLAVRWELPTIVLLRRPDETVQSWRALGLEVTERENSSRPRPAQALASGLRAYASFYRTLRSVRDRVVVADFDTIRSDYGKVIDAVNERFRCRFQPFAHTEENVARVRETTGYHALPNDMREAIKARVAEEFDHERDRLACRLVKAEEEYAFFRAVAV